MMIRFSQGSNFHAGRFLPTLALLAAGIPAVAQQATVSTALSADEVVRRVVQMNEQRANALEAYTSIRSYHLECHCLSHKTADMVVRAEYDAPNKKVFTIVSESGSGTIRSRVFKKLLEAEQCDFCPGVEPRGHRNCHRAEAKAARDGQPCFEPCPCMPELTRCIRALAS